MCGMDPPLTPHLLTTKDIRPCLDHHYKHRPPPSRLLYSTWYTMLMLMIDAHLYPIIPNHASADPPSAIIVVLLLTILLFNSCQDVTAVHVLQLSIIIHGLVLDSA